MYPIRSVGLTRLDCYRKACRPKLSCPGSLWLHHSRSLGEWKTPRPWQPAARFATSVDCARPRDWVYGERGRDSLASDSKMALFAKRRFIGMKRMALARKNSSSSAVSRADPVWRQPRSPYVLCGRNRGYRASLELRKVYRQIADTWAHRHGLIRIVDESGEDYLYPRDFFVSIPIPKAARAALRLARRT